MGSARITTRGLLWIFEGRRIVSRSHHIRNKSFSAGIAQAGYGIAQANRGKRGGYPGFVRVAQELYAARAVTTAMPSPQCRYAYAIIDEIPGKMLIIPQYPTGLAAHRICFNYLRERGPAFSSGTVRRTNPQSLHAS